MGEVFYSSLTMSSAISSTARYEFSQGLSSSLRRARSTAQVRYTSTAWWWHTSHALCIGSTLDTKSLHADGFADNFTSRIPAEIHLFGTAIRPARSEKLCTTCCASARYNKTRSKLFLVTELNSGSELNPKSEVYFEYFQKFHGQSNLAPSDEKQVVHTEPAFVD